MDMDMDLVEMGGDGGANLPQVVAAFRVHRLQQLDVVVAVAAPADQLHRAVNPTGGGDLHLEVPHVAPRDHRGVPRVRARHQVHGRHWQQVQVCQAPHLRRDRRLLRLPDGVARRILAELQVAVEQPAHLVEQPRVLVGDPAQLPE